MATTSSAPTLGSFMSRIHAHGLDEASGQLAPFLDIQYVQLERGMALARGSAARLGQVTVGYAGVDRHKIERVVLPSGRTMVITPTRGSARLGTTTFERGRVIVARGPTELVLCTDRDYQSMFVSMPDRDGGEYIAQNDAATGSVRVRVLHVSESTLEKFESCARQLADAGEGEASRDALLDVCDAWLRQERNEELASAPSTARRQAAIRARQYIDDHLDRPLTLASVCQASYVSARALEYGFREIFGVSPIAYIRCARLSQVRRELYCSSYTSGKITQLAMKWGFWHLSQFSKDYFDLFGELPSITLGRASGRLTGSGCNCAEPAARIAVAAEL